MNPRLSDNNPWSESFVERAKRVLALNDQGDFTKPSPKLYPHQWNWDSAFIALGLAQFNLERAEKEILSLLEGQWRDGMLPQIIYRGPKEGYFPGPKQWEIKSAAHAPQGISTSGITQPPVVTVAAYEVVKKGGDLFALQVYPKLLHYHRWLHKMRDPYGDGLVAIIHPWESGLDNSPRWIEPLMNVEITSPLHYERLDNIDVPSAQRPTQADYDRFVFLMYKARNLRYDQHKIFSDFPFLIQDVAFNAILYRADECLTKLAELVNAPDDELREIQGWLGTTRKAFQNRLWDQTSGLYLDYDLNRKTMISQNTIAALIPLYAGLPDKQQAKILVEKHLLNPDEYAADGQYTHFLIPTTSKNNSYYDPVGYWRGPIWANTNWLIIEGLRRYPDYRGLADQIQWETLNLLNREEFHEYFDPTTGKGLGTDNFSWSAALALVLLSEK